jgi:hypothetical protein
MSVAQRDKARPQFRNTGQLAKTIGRRRPTVDALTVLTGSETTDAGRCRLYTLDDQVRIELASEVYDLAERLDERGRRDLRAAWGDYAERVRQIARERLPNGDIPKGVGPDAVA